MTNALEELVKELSKNGLNFDNIIALNIKQPNCSDAITFLKGDNIEELKNKLKSLNYERGCDMLGTYGLYGQILMDDNSWYERTYYDNLEWWEHKAIPKIEEVLYFDKLNNI